MDTSSKNNSHNLDHAIAGAVSGFVTRFACQPLDVIKIRFQLQVEPIANYHVSKYHSFLQAFYLILKEEGITAFWKGHIPAQLLSIVYGTTQFYSYHIFMKISYNFSLLNEWKYSTNFIAGASAGFLATIVSFPFDTIRTRLVAQSNNYTIYKGILHSCSCIIQHESPKVFFYGLLPTLLQIVPHTGLQFAFYGYVNDKYKKYYNETNISFYNSMISGSVAGLLAKTAIYPFDLSRKRLQIQGFRNGRKGFGTFFECKGLIDCLKLTIKEEGIKGLFKGLVPSQLKATMTTALHYTVYEQTLIALKALRSDISK
ncbi:mitochondrial thiamine pyrophosphate carrier [Apis mellifera caucasica]|uniref:Mitochondrial thiamine pyrophosphate carrier n=1 Tax=Apis mellifera TaxID=7460 RepID=A0A7M7GWJ2_APIME|nr:mitochondrial thiamine pyrophosphate carrier [Apis mellifera]XP_006564494.1 mitochondrial thiamine pyrophosphate carrier [Apis mellifera]XP_006564495.1 mitochondrial thiamine pyrophosphate carrier [Apis mellifera]KAG6801519.1 mitochondrial thiamine pyrophosphate carrier [Apis mellifera caucasica]KAG9436161.1 mitochondrial thiamine pyrophosphate carrier [Apis mellifera carnica]|eukprot:XP_006564492.1 mitochondrial thiamine pyrophosphate carrier [Apis mellifera]